jgi:hypothetical protein
MLFSVSYLQIPLNIVNCARIKMLSRMLQKKYNFSISDANVSFDCERKKSFLKYGERKSSEAG